MGIDHDATYSDGTLDGTLITPPVSPVTPLTNTTGGSSSITPRLGQRTFRIARVLWLFVFFCVIALFVIGIPFQYSALTANDARYPEYTDAGLVPLHFDRTVVALYDLGLDIATAAVFLIVGAVIFFRRPRERMAYLASFMLITWGTLGTNDIVRALVEARAAYAVPYRLLAALGSIGIVLFLYTLPNGRFIPRWAQWLTLGYALFTFVYVMGITSTLLGVETSGTLNFLISFGIYAFGGFAQFYRRRKYITPTQSQQLKWIMIGLTLALIGFVIASLVPRLAPAFETSGPPFTMYRIGLQTYLAFSLSAVPITIGFSVFRYRLWEIDLAVNRGLVYGGVTFALGIVFLVFVSLLQVLFQRLFQQDQAGLAIAVSTLAIGALFNPTRVRFQKFVDRKLYGIAIDFRHLQKPPVASVHLPEAEITRKFGAYRVGQLIGRGGMGEVWRAEHESLARPAAVKLLRAEANDQAGLQERFEREARTIAALRHPNIIQLFDFGKMDQDYYMVMEYIDGESLAARLKHEPISFEGAVRILREIGAALDYAHAQGIVHRDVKPSNIMLRNTGEAILMDFGIAKSNVDGGLTKAGGIVGTLHYMAPEQIMGTKDIDGRADIYALGVVAFEMLTGELPFSGDNPGVVLMGHLQRPIPDPRSIRGTLPASVTAALQRALAKKPEDRFATALEFVAALASDSKENGMP